MRQVAAFYNTPFTKAYYQKKQTYMDEQTNFIKNPDEKQSLPSLHKNKSRTGLSDVWKIQKLIEKCQPKSSCRLSKIIVEGREI